MDIGNIDSGWLAFLIAIFGGVGVKVAEKFFERGEKKLDDATAIRKELRDEVKQLRDEMRRQRDATREIQAQYYELQLKYVDLKQKYGSLLSEHKELQKKYTSMLREMDRMRSK